MPEYVNVSVVVAADGTVVEATYPQEQVADVHVQPFGAGMYDIAFITTMEIAPGRSVAKAAAEGQGQAAAKAMHCNFSTAGLSADSREFNYQVTVRVQTTPEQEPADCGFRLDLQLA